VETQTIVKEETNRDFEAMAKTQLTLEQVKNVDNEMVKIFLQKAR
jgi:hypothetical protein